MPAKQEKKKLQIKESGKEDLAKNAQHHNGPTPSHIFQTQIFKRSQIFNKYFLSMQGHRKKTEKVFFYY